MRYFYFFLLCILLSHTRRSRSISRSTPEKSSLQFLVWDEASSNEAHRSISSHPCIPSTRSHRFSGLLLHLLYLEYLDLLFVLGSAHCFVLRPLSHHLIYWIFIIIIVLMLFSWSKHILLNCIFSIFLYV